MKPYEAWGYGKWSENRETYDFYNSRPYQGEKFMFVVFSLIRQGFHKGEPTLKSINEPSLELIQDDGYYSVGDGGSYSRIMAAELTHKELLELIDKYPYIGDAVPFISFCFEYKGYGWSLTREEWLKLGFDEDLIKESVIYEALEEIKAAVKRNPPEPMFPPFYEGVEYDKDARYALVLTDSESDSQEVRTFAEDERDKAILATIEEIKRAKNDTWLNCVELYDIKLNEYVL